MKKRIIAVIAVLLWVGMNASVAQSNPGSTNATDVEMKLAWPDGQTYVNGLHDADKTISLDTLAGDVTSYDYVDWQEISGGNGESSVAYEYPIYASSFDYLYNWGAGRWPELGDGYYYSVPNGTTNFSSAPAHPSITTAGTYGLVDFVSSDGDTTYQNNDQAEIALITGGEPGSTDMEIYSITGYGIVTTYTDQSLAGSSSSIAPRQIQIGNLGNLSPAGTNGSVPQGVLYAALPAHKQISITPKVSGPGLKRINVQAQGYKLVSQCIATTPSNRARTTIGVGEEVVLSFSPALPTNVIWSTTAGGFSSITNSSTIFTAPSNAANGSVIVTITATYLGKPATKKFTVLEPTGIDRAKIAGTNQFLANEVGAGMTNQVWFAPTSVSFYRVQFMEIGTDATNVTGYFEILGPQELHHSTADHWTGVNQANQLNDINSFGPYQYPLWGEGGFKWIIPQRWHIVGSTITNSIPDCTQIFSVDSAGTAKVSKFGKWIQRTTNNIITAN